MDVNMKLIMVRAADPVQAVLNEYYMERTYSL